MSFQRGPKVCLKNNIVMQPCFASNTPCFYISLLTWICIHCRWKRNHRIRSLLLPVLAHLQVVLCISDKGSPDVFSLICRNFWWCRGYPYLNLIQNDIVVCFSFVCLFFIYFKSLCSGKSIAVIAVVASILQLKLCQGLSNIVCYIECWGGRYGATIWGCIFTNLDQNIE